MRGTLRRRLIGGGLLIALASCGDPTAPNPVVRFKLDAPTCGDPFSVRFAIDQQIVGTEVLKRDSLSKIYPTSVGTHVVSGTVLIGAQVAHDTTVTLHAGETLIALVPLYCS